MKKLTILAAVLAALAAMALPTAAAAAPSGARGASEADQKFLTGAMQGDRFEVLAGEVAQQEAQSRAVKKFGEALARAHAKLYSEGKELATKVGAPVPGKPSRLQEGLLRKLQSLDARDFDVEYLKMYVMHLRKAQALMQGL